MAHWLHTSDQTDARAFSFPILSSLCGRGRDTMEGNAPMSDEVDKALAKVDLQLAIDGFFQDKLGSEAPQAKIASRSLADSFKLVGATLMFGDKLASDAVDDITKHLHTQGYDFLLPSDNVPAAMRTAVEPALLDKAFVNGSPDARGEVFKRVGRDQAKFDALARDYGLRDARDYRKGVTPGKAPDATAAAADKSKTPNPWSAEGWSITAQGRVYRSDPNLAASLAESAGSKIGATKPPPRRAA
jgi:hypothetical protein